MDQDFFCTSSPIVIALITIIIGFIGLVLFYHANDALEKIKKTFVFYFVPEKIQLDGIIIEFIEKPIPFSNINSDNNFGLGFDSDPLNDCFFYCYVKVWSPIKNDYRTVEIEYKKFIEAKRKALYCLDFSISLKCKKYAYSDELFVY